MQRDRPIVGVQRILLRAVLVVFVLAVLVISFAAKFDHLRSATVMDQAQVARNIASGHELRTSAIRPLAVAVGGDQAEKLIFSAPLYPVVLSVPMFYTEATSKIVALVSLLFGVLTLAAVYLVCVYGLSERIAITSAVIMVLVVPFVMHVVSGTEIAYLSFLVTCLFGLLLLWSQASNQSSVWWAVAASLIIGLCWLTRYEMFMLLPCLLLFWLMTDPQGFWRRLVWTIVPFVLIATPWVVRNSIIQEQLIVSENAYMLLASTNTYPADSVLRIFANPPVHPWRTIIEHPGMMFFKFHQGMIHTYETLPSIGNPYIMSLFLFGVLLATVRHRLAALHWTLLLSIVFTAAATNLYEQAPEVLLAFVPMVVIFTVQDFADTIAELNWPSSPDRDKQAHHTAHLRAKFLTMQTVEPGRLVTIALILLTLIASYPMMNYLFAHPPAKPSATVEGLRALQERDYRLFLTDVPSPVAWYSQTTALLLPADRSDLAAIEKTGLIPDAVYLAPSEKAHRAIFPGFEKVNEWDYPGVLLERISAEENIPFSPDEQNTNEE